MSRRPSIADAMREVSGGIRAAPQPHVAAPARPATPISPAPSALGVSPPVEPPSVANSAAALLKTPPSRVGTKAITAHFPPEVRYQLKLLAAEQNRTMEDMLGEALNRLFAAYNKPEIAPGAPGSRP